MIPKRLRSLAKQVMRRRHEAAIPPYRKSDKYHILSQIIPAIKVWNLPPGDYLEFGLYRGTSFLSAFELIDRHKLNCHLYGFDSFEGLPEFGGRDAAYRHFNEGQYACSLPEFEDILRQNNVDRSRVTLIKGPYGTSLRSPDATSLPIERAAIVWVDCDLYESTVPVLEFVTPFLTSTSFVILDDWFSFGADPNAGEMRATTEWLANTPEIELVEYRKFGSSGIAFLVQRRHA